MSRATVQSLFAVAGLYDLLIGLAFLLAGSQLFAQTGVPQPNHWGYIQFGALMLMIFGLMFLTIAKDPVANRNLMPFGMLLKLFYIGIVGYYWLTSGCPALFKPFLFIDLAMLILFWMAYQSRLDPVPAT